ncbi:D-2-hydroxyacid dehydrogenase family protein [uncultured Methylobacterium sp.]|uniref:D-2-hydroxyacid dehydrogenase family protein n=1 Tax=uncultured Methylobacterium sp. TaxID=157278 RepID=UPI0035C9A12A
MLTCAILDDYQGVAAAMADWSSLPNVAVRPFREHVAAQDALVAAIADCEIVVIMRERTPFPADLFARLPRLRLLVTTGMRNAAIDLAAAGAHGVVVCGTASHPEPPVELTWALILALARRIVPEANALRAGGPWQGTIGTDLAGRRLGLLGLGKVGARVARIGQAFGMTVSAWSENLTAERAAAEGATLAASKAALLADSDVVSIHLVLGARTRGLIDAAALAAMRPHALLINTARAAIVDEAALQAALRAGRIGGAGLDVFPVEPLPADSPWRSLPNLVATPHLGYVTERNYRTYFPEIVADIRAFLDGAPIRIIA